MCIRDSYKGLVCSGDRFITDPVELSQIKGLFPEGMAVDMESGSDRKFCTIVQKETLSMRLSMFQRIPGILSSPYLRMSIR